MSAFPAQPRKPRSEAAHGWDAQRGGIAPRSYRHGHRVGEARQDPVDVEVLADELPRQVDLGSVGGVRLDEQVVDARSGLVRVEVDEHGEKALAANCLEIAR